MAVEYKREHLADGIEFVSITDPKFKSNYILVRFMTRLDINTVSENAIIPNLLVTSNKTYKTRTELTKRLSELYGSGLSTINHKLGDNQVIGISAGCICDRYALDGEKLTGLVTDILLDCIFNPQLEDDGFSKKDFLLRKQELLDSINAEINDKRTFAIIKANSVIYKNEPSSLTSYGNKISAGELSPQGCYKAYKKLLETAAIDITFAGGSDADEAAEKLKAAFLNIKRNYTESPYLSFSPVKEIVEEAVDTLDISQCKMVMAFKSAFSDVYVNKLMCVMLGGTAFSKLFTNVREKYSLCYYCAAGYVEGKGVLIVDSGVEKSNIPKAREEIINQLNALAAGDFTDEEMKNAVLSIAGDYKSNYDSTSDLSSWYFIQAIRGDYLTPEQAIEKLSRVSREEIIKAAKAFRLDTVYVMQNAERGNSE
ncbi:MAG: insulinase family protein [Oscillospiraceae bacterium]|jgi:predicted Zn-dependent peptidase